MAYSFTASSSQYLVTASVPVQNVPITIAAWGNATDATNAYALVTMANSTNDYSTYVVYMGGNATGDPIFVYNSSTTGNNSSVVTTSGYTANTWAHGAGVFAASNSRSAYVDGGGKATDTISVGTASPNRIGIGAWVQVITQRFMNGLIAEAAIWDGALTDAEVASIAKGFKPTRVRPQNLVFYAPLIRNIQDTRGGRAITNNNGATVAAHPRVI